jgi:hypothetical protein
MDSRQDDQRKSNEESASSLRKQSDSGHVSKHEAVGNPAASAPKTYFSEQELDQRFADRFTSSDSEFQSVMDRPAPVPPVISPW